MSLEQKRLFKNWHVQLTEEFTYVNNGESGKFVSGDRSVYLMSLNVKDKNGKALTAKAGVQIAHEMLLNLGGEPPTVPTLVNAHFVEIWSTRCIGYISDGYVVNSTKTVRGKIASITLTFKNIIDEEWARHTFDSITYIP